MIPDTLRAIGEALYGERWQSDTARLLGVDSRRVRQWMAGERPIPAGIAAKLAGALRDRRAAIDALVPTLATATPDAR